MGEEEEENEKGEVDWDDVALECKKVIIKWDKNVKCFDTSIDSFGEKIEDLLFELEQQGQSVSIEFI